MPVWLEAGFWGLVAGGALVLGAAIAWRVPRVPDAVVSSVLAFGAGVLISTLAFDLVDEAEATGGLLPTAIGLLGGSTAYVLANRQLDRRNRSSGADGSADEESDSGSAIAVGALLDGVPESVVLGMTLLGGGGVGVPVLAAIFISNLPEGLSSAAEMKKAGRSARSVLGTWGGIALASGVAGLCGALFLEDASPETVAVITAVAAGAILAMIADTMIREAYAHVHEWTGLITTLGFITAFAISRG